MESFYRCFAALTRYSERDSHKTTRLSAKQPDSPSQANSREEVLTDDEPNNTSTSQVLLVVPNAQLTRPGDWRYEKTPLKNFHWAHGCQRLFCFDGRPLKSRMALDRLLNHGVSRDWIDLVPNRRTAAVVGVLNLRDLKTQEDLLKAEHELTQWAERYSTPPYEVTAHGRSFARDGVVQRLFVFDSFQDTLIKVDLTTSKLGSNLVAFPPHEDQHMMDLHLHVVVNDLAVAIFRQLEIKIRENDMWSKEKGILGMRKMQPNQPIGTSNLGSSEGTSLSSEKGPARAMLNMALDATRAMLRQPNGAPQLLTPMDTTWEYSELSPKDADAFQKRELGRREKLAADLSLLAGSPMDAYERYSRAAELCKTSPDPLWYASALEGCAAAHIAMAEAGGYNVDSYLENNFQLPEEIMQLAHNPFSEKSKQHKQTLPAVVYALCEEALQITNRHVMLAPFQAELLLKLSYYAAHVEESHLRCRWGEGEGCYGGDPGEPRRGDKTSVAQLTFPTDLRTKDGDDLIDLNSFARLQRWTELLHRAVSCGGLDPLTRADVAANCARMALIGMQSTKWKHYDGYRLTLPRKAALFTTIAADVLAASESAESSSLWLAAAQLYSKEPNTFKEGSNYGWATIRAATLHALSQQDDPIVSEAAAEVLLTLLSDISPHSGDYQKLIDGLNKYHEEEVRYSDDSSVAASAASRYSTFPKNTKLLQHQSSRQGFFNPAHISSPLLTVAQAKWAEDEPLSLRQFPLVDEGESIIALNAVLPKIQPLACALAQRKAVSHISDLRRSMSMFSSHHDNPNQFIIYGTKPCIQVPLTIATASILTSESHLLLERSKAHGFSGKSNMGAMQTFFNPFDKEKKQAEKKLAATLVAEGEEREVLIEFSNHLSVPLEIPSCQLVFDVKGSDRIKATALSFVVPAKAKNFKVQFPFIVTAQTRQSLLDNTEDANEIPPLQKGVDFFEVTGVRVTCMSRSFFLSIGEVEEDEQIPDDDEFVESDKLVPDPASVYQRSKHNRPKKNKDDWKPRIETVPAQPNLHVSFTTSQAAIDDGTTVPVHLSDGEIFTTPSFRLHNNFGPSGLGIMERLQIVGVGLPGLPDEVLFDTDAIAAAREEEELSENSDVDDQDFDALMEEDGLPPLKMKAICEKLSLKSINDKAKSQSEGSIVNFQIAATHDMGNQLANGGNVRIRFRYRGLSPNPATEIWRKREVSLRIVRVKGPRISSLTFRSDLSWGSSYYELCESLAQQKIQHEAMKKKWESLRSRRHADLQRYSADLDDSILTRVGMDQCVHVASDDVVVLMAVANETNSTVILSNRKGLVGGFQGAPMPTVRVTSGVSVKIPVVIPRISRISSDGEGIVTDIAAELVANTALQWETVLEDTVDDDLDVSASGNNTKKRTTGSVLERATCNDAANRKPRQGRVRIPSKCLREIIAEHPSFAARICKSPVTIKVSIGRSDNEAALQIRKCTPVDTFVDIETAEWVQQELIEACTLVLEFCCARKNSTGNPYKRDYIWIGLIRRTVPWKSKKKEHRARICFLEDGAFVVSACVKISRDGGAEETWWAPLAENIEVGTSS